jgi:hypothetical protein
MNTTFLPNTVDSEPRSLECRRNSWLACRFTVILLFLLMCRFETRLCGETPVTLFQDGNQAYINGDHKAAAQAFRTILSNGPASGVLHNQGNAEWKCGRTGPAILAWERANWLEPFDANTIANLRFARKSAHLEAPNLTWYEICSTWMSSRAWAWLAMFSFWSGLAMVMLPGSLRKRRADWLQGVAAGAFAIFFICIPALAGIHTRSALGVILSDQTPLRLTPTREAQFLANLAGGEMARVEMARGKYLYIRTGNDSAGWIERTEFGLISRKNPSD